MATKLLDTSDNSQGAWYNFMESDTGIVYLRNTSAASGDKVRIYGTWDPDAPEIRVIDEFAYSDLFGTDGNVSDDTLVATISPVVEYMSAHPVQGSWEVYADDQFS